MQDYHIRDPLNICSARKTPMISQREVGWDVDSFASGLRSMMREDP